MPALAALNLRSVIRMSCPKVGGPVRRGIGSSLALILSDGVFAPA